MDPLELAEEQIDLLGLGVEVQCERHQPSRSCLPRWPRLRRVSLSGEGIVTGSGSNAGPTRAGLSSTSFYACSGCTTGGLAPDT